MKKISKILLCVVLSITLTFSTIATTYAASHPSTTNPTEGQKYYSKIEKTGYNLIQKAIDGILGAIVNIFPEIGWESLSEYKNDDFMPGNETFVDNADENNYWKMGYSKKSIIPENLAEKGYSLGGYFNMPQIKATSVADGQFVRAICVDDNSSRGKAIFAVVDGAGLSNVDICEIRSRLKNFAEENNIISINISVTHAHSCIDTQGLSANLIKAIFLNPVIAALNLKIAPETGKDAEFMELLFNQTVAACKEAANSATRGKLYYGNSDISQYLRDKRAPMIMDTNLNRLRFVPENAEEKEIYIANMGAHPTSISRTTTAVSSDYPFYFEKYVNEQKNADFIFIQGAQAAITTEKSLVHKPGNTSYQELEAYGERLGQIFLNINNEKEVEPYFNIKITQPVVKASNQILILAAKAQLVNNRIVYADDAKKTPAIVSEVGYAEFGSQVAVALIPGEISPELIYGGSYSADLAWTNKEWEYKAYSDVVDCENLIVFGLCNDAIGYIMPDNDYGSFLAEKHYEETVSAGKEAGSIISKSFIDLVNSTK